MNNSLVILQRDWNALLSHLAGHADERMAFAYCGRSESGENVQYLVRSVDPPPDEQYRFQGAAGVSLKAEYALPRAVRARDHAAFIDVHSHPFTSTPRPSPIDDDGAGKQMSLLRRVAPDTALIRLVFGRAGSGTVWAEVTAPRKIDWTPINRIVVVGSSRREVIHPVNSRAIPAHLPSGRDLRTNAVIGTAGSLRRMHILVVGGGGTGSAVLAQLRGYVDRVTIVDPDVVEEHNAPRLYHYNDGDAGRYKAEIHAREMRRAFPGIDVQVICAAFPDEESVQAFKAADLVFCCPDHNAVRYAAARLAMRYLKPLIEIGCGGRAIDGRLAALGYHVRLQIPGGPCLACSGLDLRELEDPSSTEAKRRAGYVSGEDDVRGELMPLTTRAAADGVDLFFRYVTGYAGTVIPHHLYFDALRLRTIDASPACNSHPLCPLCGHESDELLGAGDEQIATQQILPANEGGPDHASLQ